VHKSEFDPDISENVPAMHCLQDLAANSVEYSPALHAMQAVAPKTEINFPALQERQSFGEYELTAVEYVPGSHA
jgi:hypothetical protein